MKKRQIALLLALLCTLPGCAKEPAPVETTATSDTTTPAPVETELTDNLPEKDMDGAELHMLNTAGDSLSWADVRVLAEKLDGEVVNDGLYNRQKTIEERFNATMSQEEAGHGDIINLTKTMVSAGDTAYQAVFAAESGYGGMLPYVVSWNDIPYLQYTERHWNPGATSIFEIDGKQTALAGNVSLSVVSRAVCMVFNKRIFADHFTGESLYEQVENNTWTLDIWLRYATSVGTDLDGDGAWTAADLYGMNMGRGFKGYIASFLGASGYHFTTNDAAGLPVFTMHTDENTLNLVQKLMDIMTTGEGYYYNEDTSSHGFAPADLFSGGHTLFTQGVPHDIYKLREMEDDLGILPMPKLNEAQEQYYAASWGGHVLMLPKTVEPDGEVGENLGILLEAMSFAGYYDLLPLYKEVALKSKTARDEESAAMLDIIYASTTFDFGTNILYDSVITPEILEVLWQKKDPSIIVSTCTAKEKKLAEYTDKMMTAVADIP